MSAAKLQQVGSPQELYDHPANRFVAGFIGSPAMNFIDATVRGSGGLATLISDGVDMAVPGTYPLRDAQSVVIGMRPEHLELVEPTGLHGAIHGSADVVEYLGNEELIHVTSGGHDLIALVDSSYHVKAGDAITLYAPLEKVHFFDTEVGLALVPQQAAMAAA
jgi:multiple sugar transport system ATP-binding protein